MIPAVLHGLRLIHIITFSLVAIGLFKFWKETRFWLPRYAHVLAGIGFAVGIGVVLGVPADAPLARQNPVLRVLFALVVPAIVYFFFIAYGGQKAAFHRSRLVTEKCPFCGNDSSAYLTRDKTVRFVDANCENCGQAIHH